MRGHGMADCPVLKDESEHIFKRCRKCGSTEHKTNLCSAKLSPGIFITNKLFQVATLKIT